MTEQPRGSVARRLQHAINHGNYNPDLLDAGTLSFIVILLAPHYGQRATLTTKLAVSEPKTTNTAPPTPTKPHPTDDVGLPSHTIGRERRG